MVSAKRGPAGLRRRLLRLGGIAVVALCVEGWFVWSQRGQHRSQALGSDMAMVLAARDRIVSAGLVHAAKDCLAFFIHDAAPGQPVLLDVFEKHTEACKGDPAAPRLFGVRVDRSDGQMWDDAAQAGVFAILPG